MLGGCRGVGPGKPGEHCQNTGEISVENCLKYGMGILLALNTVEKILAI
jgi:hypothetical protein